MRAPSRLPIALSAVALLCALPATAQMTEPDMPAHMRHDMEAGNHTMPPQSALATVSADTRQTVDFSPRDKQATLRDMRSHLMAISDIQAALSKGDFEIAAHIADSRLGLSSTQQGGMLESARHMPSGMRQLGFAMHKSASQFAIAAQDASVSGDVRPALAALANITANCVACHAAYKFK